MKTILVVDDEDNIREITKATLEKFGYRVLTAADGTDAVGVFAQHKDDIELVLTDMAMPFLDGIGTVRAIRRLDPSAKFVVMSGLMNVEATAELESLEINGSLTKPFTTETLLTTLFEILRKDP